MLESEEAARRLGVKLSTLYAYVSRGLLTSHPGEHGRRRLFDAGEVEVMARRARGDRQVQSRLASVTTAITQLRDDGAYYRGRAVVDLAGHNRFEEVAALLWDVEDAPDQWRPRRIPRPPALDSSDLVPWVTVLCGSQDRFRADLRPETVVRAARHLIATVVESLPPSGAPAPEGDRSVAARLGRHLIPNELSENERGEAVRTINLALVLLADHELATSTVAVRVAASTRADLYDATLAGLGTLGGPFHGGASQLAHALILEADRTGVERAMHECLRWQGALPGFGHAVYKDLDPRVAPLLECFERIARPEQQRVVSTLIDLASRHDVPAPNIDLALAAVLWATGMAPDAGRTIFTVARMAGWTAHYLEELGERPLRFRARAVYAASR
jgi:citrate synthase